jgi:hypothetical protein
MTPQEKAMQLFNNAFIVVQVIDKYQYLTRDEERDLAKRIASESVDQLITEYDEKICGFGYDNDWAMWDEQKQYCINVKQEIINL